MLNAATLAVLPGESIQAQIDAASEGDIVAVFGGTYSENITINKAIRLVEVSGQDVTILDEALRKIAVQRKISLDEIPPSPEQIIKEKSPRESKAKTALNQNRRV